MPQQTPRDGEHPAAAGIRLLLLDVDGVLTDGRVWIDEQGREMLAFHIQDGVALRLWQRTGRLVGLLSGRDLPTIRHRAQQLRVNYAMLGRNDKLDAFNELIAESQIPADRIAYVGDDLLDLPVLSRCGYPIAVANAVEPVRQIARFVTQRPGGQGAMFEVVRHLLSMAGEWQARLAEYIDGSAGRMH